MAKFENIINKRFGKLIALYPTKRMSGNTRYWMCQCDCGKQKEILKYHLTHGTTKSCGCLRREVVRIKPRKHYGCMYCGSDKHYAKGCCRNCYGKLNRGTLE